MFYRQFRKKIRLFRANFRKISIFLRQFHKKFRFFRQKFAIYSYSWVNHSISFQKSPFSNILPVHDNLISYSNILPPVNDPPATLPLRIPCPKSGGSRPPTPPGLTPMLGVRSLSLSWSLGVGS